MFEINLPGVIFEEFLFRGVIWEALLQLNFRKEFVLVFSGLLFWLAHYNFYSNGIWFRFWLVLPYISLYYGLMLLRGQSIFRTTIYHIGINVLIAIYKITYL